jgi:dihydrofolate synthase/folylpolyglutamate synthase
MQDASAKGLEQRPPCRFETFDVQCNGKPVQAVLDIGHNPPAVTTLVAKAKGHARRCGKRIRMIVGMSRDKDIPSSLHITFVQASHPRATPVPVLEAILHGRRVSEADVRAAVDDDHTRRTVQEQLQLCAESNEILLVCGTAFIMAEVRAAIGIVEPRVR